MPGMPPVQLQLIQQFVDGHPGCSSREIIDGTPLTIKQVRQILWFAARSAQLLRTGTRRHHRYWPITTPLSSIPAGPRGTRAPRRCILTAVRQNIIDFVTSHPGCSATDIFGDSPPCHSFNQLRKLVDNGYLARTGTHRHFRYTAAQRPAV